VISKHLLPTNNVHHDVGIPECCGLRLPGSLKNHSACHPRQGQGHTVRQGIKNPWSEGLLSYPSPPVSDSDAGSDQGGNEVAHKCTPFHVACKLRAWSCFWRLPGIFFKCLSFCCLSPLRLPRKGVGINRDTNTLGGVEKSLVIPPPPGRQKKGTPCSFGAERVKPAERVGEC
jgi:hypothetical protein